MDATGLANRLKADAPPEAVAALRAALFRTAWLRTAVRGAVVYVLGWGLVTLVSRAWGRGADGVSGLAWWWGTPGLLAVAAGAAWWAHRRTPGPDAVAALLDRQRGLGGLAMSASADGFAPWSAAVAAARAPAVRWRGGPAWAALGLAAAFLVGAAFAPMPKATAEGASLHVRRQLDGLREQVAVLEEEQVIEQPRADALRDDAQRVAERAQADDPVRTWEALDHLANELAAHGAEAQDAAQQQAADAAAAAALAGALDPARMEAAGGLSDEQLTGALDALAELSAAALAGDLPPMLAGLDAGALAAGLDAETLETLAELMEGRGDELAAMMAALQEAGLGDGKGKGAGGDPVVFDPDALAEFLSQCEGGACDGAAIAVACRGGGRPGRGGISRGPGHAEMTWKDPAAREGASFDPAVLPPSAVRDPEQSRRLGISRSAPQTADGGDGASAGGGLAGVTSGGGAAAGVVVVPRHRGAVRRYFERSEKRDGERSEKRDGERSEKEAIEPSGTEPR